MRSQRNNLQSRALFDNDINCIDSGAYLSVYFSAVISSLLHNPNMIGYQADDCIGLLPIFVHLAKIYNKIDELEQILTDVCLSSPLILQRAYYVFCRFRLEPVAGRLFSKVVKKNSIFFYFLFIGYNDNCAGIISKL